MYSFIYTVGSHAVSGSDCIASNDTMIIVSNEFERVKKEVFIAYFKVFQLGTEENYKKCK
jgi:hypothetical protein